MLNVVVDAGSVYQKLANIPDIVHEQVIAKTSAFISQVESKTGSAAFQILNEEDNVGLVLNRYKNTNVVGHVNKTIKVYREHTRSIPSHYKIKANIGKRMSKSLITIESKAQLNEFPDLKQIFIEQLQSVLSGVDL